MREDYIHCAVRKFLKQNGWQLIAGQYPNGSDDELPILNITDPAVARDNSPDPRRHALDKIVLDLVALKETSVLIIEMKPRFNASDLSKLLELIDNRKQDLITALEQLRASNKTVGDGCDR